MVIQLNEHVVMNGNTIEWVDNVRHLGNFVDVALSCTLDCGYKRSMFIGHLNNNNNNNCLKSNIQTDLIRVQHIE